MGYGLPGVSTDNYGLLYKLLKIMPEAVTYDNLSHQYTNTLISETLLDVVCTIILLTLLDTMYNVL
jgi:hypothetical protein